MSLLVHFLSVFREVSWAEAGSCDLSAATGEECLSFLDTSRLLHQNESGMRVPSLSTLHNKAPRIYQLRATHIYYLRFHGPRVQVQASRLLAHGPEAEITASAETRFSPEARDAPRARLPQL